MYDIVRNLISGPRGVHGIEIRHAVGVHKTHIVRQFHQVKYINIIYLVRDAYEIITVECPFYIHGIFFLSF